MRSVLMSVALCGLALAGSIDDSLGRAARLLEQDDPGQAWDVLEAALVKHPRDVRLSVKLGEVFLKMAAEQTDVTAIVGFYLDADRMFQAAPGDPDALYGRAFAQFQISGSVTGAREKAAALVAECLALDRGHGRAHALAGHIHYCAKRFDSAAEAYERATALDGAEAIDFVRYGHCFIAMGDREKAKRTYIEGLAHHPRSDLPIRSGLYHLAGKDWRTATDVMAEATASAAASPAAWYYLGYSQFLNEDWESAASAFARAIALDATQAEYPYYLGQAEEKLGRGEAALDHYRAALKLDARHEGAAAGFERYINNQGMIKVKRFATLYEELLALAPDNPWVHNNYAYLLRNQAEEMGAVAPSRTTKAMRWMLKRSAEAYEVAARLRPDDPQIQSDLGLVYEFYPATRNDARAEEQFTRALRLEGYVYRDALKGLIRLCERTGDWETLQEYTELAVESMEAGGAAVAPGGADGAPVALNPAQTAQILKLARVALDNARFHIETPDALVKVPVPALVREDPSDGPWPAPAQWRIERPASPRGEPHVLRLTLDPERAHVFECSAATTTPEGRSKAVAEARSTARMSVAPDGSGVRWTEQGWAG